jgi:hypothetical protein
MAKKIIRNSAQMRYRKLRIAWSVVCGILGVLLIGLWVRSYWWSDIVSVSAPSCDARSDSANGGTTISIFFDSNREAGYEWSRNSYRHNTAMRPPDATWKFDIYMTRRGLDASLPHWFYLLLTSLIAAAAWIRRFTLRTLLIATTLVAVVLRLSVWPIRR